MFCTWSPSQDAGQIVTGAQRDDGARRRRALAVLADVVQTLQHPADGSVAAAHQNAVVLDVAEDVEARQRAADVQVVHLERVQQFAEAGDKFETLAAARLDVDEHQQRLDAGWDQLWNDVGQQGHCRSMKHNEQLSRHSRLLHTLVDSEQQFICSNKRLGRNLIHTHGVENLGSQPQHQIIFSIFIGLDFLLSFSVFNVTQYGLIH